MKKLNIFLFLLVSLFSFLSCNTKNEQQNIETQQFITFTDDANHLVKIQNKDNLKVAVLQGSLAHIWLNAGGTIAAATNDAFTEPSEKPVLKKDTQDSIINLGSMMSPNSELLLSDNYDFVIMSANIAGHKKLAQLFDNVNIPYAFFKIETFSDYMNMMKICKDITKDNQSYEKNAIQVQKSVEEQIEKSKQFSSQMQKRVLVLRAASTSTSARTSSNEMTASMLKELGCINIADSNKAMTENLSIEKIMEENPEYIFITTMGSNPQKAIKALNEKFVDNPAWNTLQAVQDEKVIILPRELFHYKPCERWAECYEMLNKILYK